MKRKYFITLTALALAMTISGCSTQIKQPDNSPTMGQAYDRALSASSNTDDPNNADNQDLSSVRHLVNQNGFAQANSNSPGNSFVEAEFPMLPNPQLIMYITPHYAGDEQMPVPGYYTVFPLYEKNYYALPSEGVLNNVGGQP